MNEQLQQLAEQYVNKYLTPADPLRWAKEKCLFPRARIIYPVNQNEDIKRGYRNMCGGKIKLQKLTDNHYQGFRANIERKDNDSRKNWVFVRYADDAMLDFLAIDIDRHHKKNESPTEYNKVESRFWQQVTDIENLGIPGIWTTTPGNTINGIHLHGLNYNIFFDSPKFVFELREEVEKLRLALGWSDISTQLDAGDGFTRNYRPPGQWHVQIANVHSDNEYITQRTCNWAGDFLQEWNKRPVVEWDFWNELIGSESVESIVAPKPQAETELQPEVKPQKPKKTICYIDTDTQIDCAFRRLIGYKGKGNSILSPIVAKYGGKTEFKKQMMEEAKAAFIARSIPYGFLDHTNNPARLEKLITDKLDWFCKHFDQKKSISQWRIEKDRTDELRFSQSAKLNLKTMLRKIGTLLSYKEKQIFSKFWNLACKFNGRVAAKSIYNWAKTQGFCTCRQWKKIRNKLINSNILVISDSHNTEKKICTQYAASSEFILDVKSSNISGGNSSLLREEKKREIVYVTPLNNPVFGGAAPAIKQVNQLIDDIFDGTIDKNKKIPTHWALG